MRSLSSALRVLSFSASACLLVGCSLPSAATASTESKLRAPLPFSYTEDQPKTQTEVRDPCIIREGDTYYLVFTMWPFSNRDENKLERPNEGGSPGIALYASKDMKSWQFKNWLVKSSQLPKDSPYKNRFWAPEIHKINGKFYLIFTADNWSKKEYNPAGTWGAAGYAFVGVADTIAGPYKHITYVDGGTCDMSLFADTDGQVYAVKPKKDIYIQKIDLSRITEDKVELIGKEKKVLDYTSDDTQIKGDDPAYLEGPWMRKIGAKYYLFYAAYFKYTGGKRSEYWTGVATADTPLGPWVKDPRGKVFEGGHLAVFDTPRAGLWFSHRGEHRSPDHGKLFVTEFKVGPDGSVQPGSLTE